MSDKKEKDPKADFRESVYQIQGDYEDRRKRTECGFGLCDSCQYFRYAKSDYDHVVFARCYEFESKLHTNRPIRECSPYKRVGEMGLMEMAELAYFIESRPKDKIGFGNGGDNDNE